MTGYILIALAASIWGIMNFSVKPLDKKGVPLAVQGLVASFVGSCMLGVTLLHSGFGWTTAWHSPMLKLLVIVGVLEGTNVLASFKAFQCTTVTRAMLAKYLAPTFLVFIFGPLLLKEYPTFWMAGAAFMGLLGLAMLPKPADDGSKTHHVQGIFFGAIAAMLVACMLALERIIAKSGFDPYFSVFVKMSLRTLIFAGFFASAKSQREWPKEKKYWALLVLLGALLTLSLFWLFLGNGMLPKGNKAGILTYFDAVVAIGLASVFLREKMTLRTVAGGALILASGILIVFV